MSHGESDPAHSAHEIARAAASWFWVPRGGDSDETLGARLARYPAGWGGGVRASRFDSSLPAAGLVDAVIDRVRAWGESALTVWTSPSDRPELTDELRARGAVHSDTVEVFALDLRSRDAGVEALRGGVSTELVRTAAQVREIDAINVAVWRQTPLDEEGARLELAEIEEALADSTEFRVLARIGGRAVSTGGCTLVDGFARLWGAATLDDARGRGAYRAVLAERLRVAAELGARTALVKGRTATSAPILARAGFVRHGEERSYRLDV